MECINIDLSINKPIYKQIIQSICDHIDDGTLKAGDPVPSVNQVAHTFGLARGSVFTAYNELKASGIIKSVPGKGFFVSSVKTGQQYNIFLLFTTFSPYKEILYNALITSLKGKCNVDIYFHHYNIKIFEQLITDHANQYNAFIIMPIVHERVPEILSVLNTKSVYLLDLGYQKYGDRFAGVYQNFENDIYRILKSNLHLIGKYCRLFLVCHNGFRSTEILAGFNRFACESPIETGVVSIDQHHDIQLHDAYIAVEDIDMVSIIQTAKQKGWKIGKDIGILSYNETALKSVISDGISTISTDFNLMGMQIAKMVLNREQKAIENKFVMIDRNSF
jgi:DNA-binding transcriptional regulator YhcF (GntR family)